MRSNIWKGSISFGLLNIPVSLQTANEDKELHFSLLDSKDMAHIQYKKVNAKTGREVKSNQIVKGYEYKPGRFVTITDADFEKANTKATKTIEIEDFVYLSEIETMMFEKPYYIAPQKGAEKGYFLLRAALEKTEKVAIAKIVLRTKQHLAVVFPRGDYLILEMLRFAHEMKSVDEVNYLSEVNKRIKFSDRELKMAEDLIKGMTAKWKPEKYKDTYYDDMMKRIKAKIKQGRGQKVDEIEEVEDVEESSNVIDLLPLLQKSLAAKRGTNKTSAKAKTKVNKRTDAKRKTLEQRRA